MKKKTIYFDGLHGLIPVKPIQRIDTSIGVEYICQVTADRPGYKRGEKIIAASYRLVFALKNQRCMTVGIENLDARIK